MKYVKSRKKLTLEERVEILENQVAANRAYIISELKQELRDAGFGDPYNAVQEIKKKIDDIPNFFDPVRNPWNLWNSINKGGN